MMKTFTLKSVFAGMGVVVGVLTLVWCSTLDKIDQDPHYQKAKDVIGSWAGYVSEKTTDLINSNATTKKWADKAQEMWANMLSGAKWKANELIEQGKEALHDEVEKIKSSAKQKIKSGINHQIDESFDAL